MARLQVYFLAAASIMAFHNALATPTTRTRSHAQTRPFYQDDTLGRGNELRDLQNLLGKTLPGSDDEKDRVVELLLRLLSEIDLPALCDVISKETKEAMSAFSKQANMRSVQRKDKGILNSKESQSQHDNYFDNYPSKNSFSKQNGYNQNEDIRQRLALAQKQRRSFDNEDNAALKKRRGMKRGLFMRQGGEQQGDSINSDGTLPFPSNPSERKKFLRNLRRDVKNGNRKVLRRFRQGRVPLKRVAGDRFDEARSQRRLENFPDPMSKVRVESVPVEKPRSELYSRALVIGDWMPEREEVKEPTTRSPVREYSNEDNKEITRSPVREYSDEINKEMETVMQAGDEDDEIDNDFEEEENIDTENTEDLLMEMSEIDGNLMLTENVESEVITTNDDVDSMEDDESELFTDEEIPAQEDEVLTSEDVVTATPLDDEIEDEEDDGEDDGEYDNGEIVDSNEVLADELNLGDELRVENPMGTSNKGSDEMSSEDIETNVDSSTKEPKKNSPVEVPDETNVSKFNLSKNKNIKTNKATQSRPTSNAEISEETTTTSRKVLKSRVPLKRSNKMLRRLRIRPNRPDRLVRPNGLIKKRFMTKNERVRLARKGKLGKRKFRYVKKRLDANVKKTFDKRNPYKTFQSHDDRFQKDVYRKSHKDDFYNKDEITRDLDLSMSDENDVDHSGTEYDLEETVSYSDLFTNARRNVNQKQMKKVSTYKTQPSSTEDEDEDDDVSEQSLNNSENRENIDVEGDVFSSSDLDLVEESSRQVNFKESENVKLIPSTELIEENETLTGSSETNNVTQDYHRISTNKPSALQNTNGTLHNGLEVNNISFESTPSAATTVSATYTPSTQATKTTTPTFNSIGAPFGDDVLEVVLTPFSALNVDRPETTSVSTESDLVNTTGNVEKENLTKLSLDLSENNKLNNETMLYSEPNYEQQYVANLTEPRATQSTTLSSTVSEKTTTLSSIQSVSTTTLNEGIEDNPKTVTAAGETHMDRESVTDTNVASTLLTKENRTIQTTMTEMHNTIKSNTSETESTATNESITTTTTSTTTATNGTVSTGTLPIETTTTTVADNVNSHSNATDNFKFTNTSSDTSNIKNGGNTKRPSVSTQMMTSNTSESLIHVVNGSLDAKTVEAADVESRFGNESQKSKPVPVPFASNLEALIKVKAQITEATMTSAHSPKTSPSSISEDLHTDESSTAGKAEVSNDDTTVSGESLNTTYTTQLETTVDAKLGNVSDTPSNMTQNTTPTRSVTNTTTADSLQEVQNMQGEQNVNKNVSEQLPTLEARQSANIKQDAMNVKPLATVNDLNTNVSKNIASSDSPTVEAKTTIRTRIEELTLDNTSVDELNTTSPTESATTTTPSQFFEPVFIDYGVTGDAGTQNQTVSKENSITVKVNMETNESTVTTYQSIDANGSKTVELNTNGASSHVPDDETTHTPESLHKITEKDNTNTTSVSQEYTQLPKMTDVSVDDDKMSIIDAHETTQQRRNEVLEPVIVDPDSVDAGPPSGNVSSHIEKAVTQSSSLESLEKDVSGKLNNSQTKNNEEVTTLIEEADSTNTVPATTEADVNILNVETSDVEIGSSKDNVSRILSTSDPVEEESVGDEPEGTTGTETETMVHQGLSEDTVSGIETEESDSPVSDSDDVHEMTKNAPASGENRPGSNKAIVEEVNEDREPNNRVGENGSNDSKEEAMKEEMDELPMENDLENTRDGMTYEPSYATDSQNPRERFLSSSPQVIQQNDAFYDVWPGRDDQLLPNGQHPVNWNLDAVPKRNYEAPYQGSSGRPRAVPYSGLLSDWWRSEDEEKAETVYPPRSGYEDQISLSPWKRMNMQVGREKADFQARSQSRYYGNTQPNLVTPDQGSFGGYNGGSQYAFSDDVHHLRPNSEAYLWNARPWPRHALSDSYRQFEKRNMFAAKKDDFLRGSRRSDYRQGGLNDVWDKADSDRPSQRVPSTDWGNRFSQGFYGRVLESQNKMDLRGLLERSEKETTQANFGLKSSKSMSGEMVTEPDDVPEVLIPERSHPESEEYYKSDGMNTFDRDAKFAFDRRPNYQNAVDKPREAREDQIDMTYFEMYDDARGGDVTGSGADGQHPVTARAAQENDVTSDLTVGVPAPGDIDCQGMFGYHRDPKNCQAFFICSWGVPYRIYCPPGTLWNARTLTCDWAVNVDCPHDY